MACGSYPDAYDRHLYRSFREQLRECILPGEEFRPLHYLYLGQCLRVSIYFISAADSEQ